MIHKIAYAAILSGLIAQVFKVLIDLLKTRRLNLIKILDTGGMPSSHTSLVTTLTIGVGSESGINSAIFSVALIFSLYFIFEATGLRQEVGKQARVLNEMVDEMLLTHQFNARRLRELVGHTWIEIYGGFVVGVAVALIAFY
jgi:acid phosphatase family membrane protein YuiD